MKRHCYYFCRGYCFYNGDDGRVCDTDDNRQEGYCPMEKADEELREISEAMINEMEREE